MYTLNYRKFCLLFILLSHLLIPVSASSNELLKCLGREELVIHKMKMTGPVYKLNQLFITEMASWGGIQLKKKYLKSICANDEYTPSVNFMRSLLIDGGKIFEMKKGVSNANLRALNEGRVKSLLSSIPHIFFKYLSDLQAISSYPHCLNEKIPELPYFLERFKYLEEEYPAKELIKDKLKLNSIFTKIKRLDVILKSCEKIQLKRQGQRKSN
ncbi:MAG: hypothetical protein KC493_11815 [Bacteriovoracaceae bacterium]|nr:hypothetical protein [Bacteriovoracaceae bacterium]